MKKRAFLISIVAIGLLASAYFVFLKGGQKEAEYTFGEVTKGNLKVVITSTGTLDAVSSVDVGTQVSGKISKLYADFNSEVRKGSLLAVLDTVTLAAQVRDAEINLAKSKAEYNQKATIHERNKKLFEKNFLSELDFIQSKTDLESAVASLRAAESSVAKAKTNLDYAYIYAPISGKIVNRAVEEGQTVAASFSTPTLFTIAQDLSSMKIIANVDESDIGQIKEGQKVTFTVQSYSDKVFDGVVTQIRMKSSTSSNVVNYPVVIKANNNEKLLMPGMTATIDFYVDQRDNVLLVPNSALKYEASETIMAGIKNDMEKEMKGAKGNKDGAMAGMPPGGAPFNANANNDINGNSQIKNSISKVFYKDSLGRIKMAMLKTGLTDGKNTEIVESKDLTLGMKLITGSVEETSTTKQGTNVLNSQQGGGMPPPPMM
jgi:HlyD family secretion protein